ncbi:MAG: rhodanese-like domain-containing protein [Proteobacteria bacterium]|nr:rhodanese-like domain-containing protein [Pseudomonadota bacterium]
MFSQIYPEDAWQILKESDSSILIDVRTQEELAFVGWADISETNSKTVFLPWRNYPEMTIDSAFQGQLVSFVKNIFADQKAEEINLLFLCRSGVRSFEAGNLMSKLNYNCYNIINGFEGDIDSYGHRGYINGWKAKNLPWRQN